MEPIGDLLKGRMESILPQGRVLKTDYEERKALIDFFYNQGFVHKDGTRFTKKQLSLRCQWLTLKDLYYIQSVYKDEKRRGHNAAWYFMGATKLVKAKGV